MKIQPVILCGGGGTRLWPLSRTSYPKQLLSPLGGLSLLQQTVQRFSSQQFEAPLIICNEDHRFLIAEQMKEIYADSRIILEPCARDTAPAMALATYFVSPEHYVFFTPADHQIENPLVLEQAIQYARSAADHDHIVVFGIPPDSPKTGYGYIIPGVKQIMENIFTVRKFIEKPDVATAQSLLESDCYWNSGIFFGKIDTFKNSFEQHIPDIYKYTTAAARNHKTDLDFIRINKQDFEKCKAVSIDYSVIEKSDNVAVVPCKDIRWSDIGNWQAIWELNSKDENGNAIIGDVIAQDVKNSYIRSDGLLVSVIGLENLVIVASNDAVLIVNKDNTEKVKEITTHLLHNFRSELDYHKRVYRPWGYYQEIDLGERFKVKRLMLKSQSKTSVQIHYHRAEHWVVVSGTAKVTLHETTRLIHENESIYIPAGMSHCIENPGKIELHLIEVQTGSYLGEDDIVRVKDIYGRI